MRWRGWVGLAILALGTPAAFAQTATDAWKGIDQSDLPVGAFAGILINVRGIGESVDGEITLTCTSDGPLLAISSAETLIENPTPDQIVRLKFDKAKQYEVSAFFGQTVATVQWRARIDEFIATGKRAGHLWVTINGLKARRIDLPVFSMRGFTKALGALPADCWK